MLQPKRTKYRKMHKGRNDGLAWSGNPAHSNDDHRSIGFAELFQRLPEGFQYIGLQRDVRPADKAAMESAPGFVDFSSELQDFSDTAALCAHREVAAMVAGRRTWSSSGAGRQRRVARVAPLAGRQAARRAARVVRSAWASGEAVACGAAAGGARRGQACTWARRSSRCCGLARSPRLSARGTRVARVSGRWRAAQRVAQRRHGGRCGGARVRVRANGAERAVAWRCRGRGGARAGSARS